MCQMSTSNERRIATRTYRIPYLKTKECDDGIEVYTAAVSRHQPGNVATQRTSIYGRLFFRFEMRHVSGSLDYLFILFFTRVGPQKL